MSDIKILLEYNPNIDRFSYCIVVDGIAPNYYKGARILVDFLENILDCLYTNGTSPYLKLVGEEENE